MGTKLQNNTFLLRRQREVLRMNQLPDDNICKLTQMKMQQRNAVYAHVNVYLN